jgi:hypothetical protein
MRTSGHIRSTVANEGKVDIAEPRPNEAIDPTQTSASVSCRYSKADFSPYQNTLFNTLKWLPECAQAPLKPYRMQAHFGIVASAAVCGAH